MFKKISLFVGLLVAFDSLFTACNKSEDAGSTNTTGKTKFGIPVAEERVQLPSYPFQEVKLLKSGIVIKDTLVTFRAKKKKAIKITSGWPEYGTMVWMLPAGVPHNLLGKKSGDTGDLFYYSYAEAKSFSEDGWREPTFEEANVLYIFLEDGAYPIFPNAFELDYCPSYGYWDTITGLMTNPDDYYFWTNDYLKDIDPDYANADRCTIHSTYNDISGYNFECLYPSTQKARMLLVKKL